MGASWWSSGEDSALQGRGRGLTPGQGTKLPRARACMRPRAPKPTQRSGWARATAPQLTRRHDGACLRRLRRDAGELKK